MHFDASKQLIAVFPFPLVSRYPSNKIMMRLNKHPGAAYHLKIPESIQLHNEVTNVFQFPATFYEHFVKHLQ